MMGSCQLGPRGDRPVLGHQPDREELGYMCPCLSGVGVTERSAGFLLTVSRAECATSGSIP